MRALAERVLVIDDHGSAGEYDADLVVDQNVGATRADYPPDTRLLAGPRYALATREFRSARRSAHRRVTTAQRIAFLAGERRPRDCGGSSPP